MDWEFLGNPDKTAQYLRWMDDPAVGGELLRYVDDRRARVWLKDVPMKEYARAKEGIGHYVRYVVRRFKGPQEVVDTALGAGWSVLRDSIGEKPHHCLAVCGEETRYVCWGRVGGFRDLVWAAITKAVERGDRPCVVVTTRDGEFVAEAERRHGLRIAGHCGIDLSYLHREMLDNPDYVG